MMIRTSPRADGLSIRSKLDQIGSSKRAFARLFSSMTTRGIWLSLLIGGSLLASLSVSDRTGQDDYGGDKTKPKVKGHKPKPQPPAKPPLLAINWQIQTIDKKGLEVPIAPNATDWSNVEAARI